MEVKRISKKGDDLLDPKARSWRAFTELTLPLIGTPVGVQPSPYTKAAWKDREIGAVKSVQVRACHDNESIYIRLEWEDPSEDLSAERGGAFVDAAAVAFPIDPDAPINTMGNEQAGVNAWQWKADSDRGRSVIAYGLGTSEPSSDEVRTGAKRKGDRWQVVISRRLSAVTGKKTSVNLVPGESTRFGVAIWEGGHGERAGFKAYTENWIDIRIV